MANFTPGDSIKKFSEETRWLSNFWPSPVRATLFGRSEIWPSAENLYQASKLAHSNLTEAEKMVYFEEFLTVSPGQSKRRGSEFELNESWLEARLEVMEAVVTHRFQSNFEDYNKLADIDGVFIEEGNSWGDIFWGVDEETREGENNLGLILMDLAGELNRERSREMAEPGLIDPLFWTEGYKEFYLNLDSIIQ